MENSDFNANYASDDADILFEVDLTIRHIFTDAITYIIGRELTEAQAEHCLTEVADELISEIFHSTRRQKIATRL